MRIIKTEDYDIPIRASVLALHLYHQAFKDKDNDADAINAVSMLALKAVGMHNLLNNRQALEGLEDFDITQFDYSKIEWESIVLPAIEVLQLCFAMAQAQNKYDSLPTQSFEAWLEKHEDIQPRDIQRDVLEEAIGGFFRKGSSAKQPKGR